MPTHNDEREQLVRSAQHVLANSNDAHARRLALFAISQNAPKRHSERLRNHEIATAHAMLRASGTPAMDAYRELGEWFYLSEETVRRIVREYSKHHTFHPAPREHTHA